MYTMIDYNENSIYGYRARHEKFIAYGTTMLEKRKNELKKLKARKKLSDDEQVRLQRLQEIVKNLEHTLEKTKQTLTHPVRSYGL